MAYKAAHGLTEKYPSMSAAPISNMAVDWWQRLQRGCFVAALAVVPLLLMGSAWSGALALWFLVFIGLRVAGSLWPRKVLPALPRLPDSDLPVYTVIAALYREASSVGPLLQAINALDYPKEKLDIILVVEPDDLHTRAAIARQGPMSNVQLLIAPDVAPKTKPKALNAALPFARGSFIAVFDAEDRPEPGQLHAALNAFRSHSIDVACAQASLCIDNATNSWLSRMFEAEYAGQFDVYLPGLAAMGLPLPLGGSSNHFRAAALREVGGWDAYNVTEDADLGFRLARFNYRSVTFQSTTFEEAPVSFGSWLRQRSRWMKGWVQTWLVHMSHPLRLWREAGPLGFFALNVVVGGNILTALSLPLLLYVFLANVLAGAFADMPLRSYLDWPTPLHVTAIAAGFSSTVLVGLMGLAQRGRLRRGWILIMTLPYWICLSLAAWRAVWQYVWTPYRWEKTDHGLAQRTGPPVPPKSAPANAPLRYADHK
jgi:cellulose synthase/poly-beta-1,6-N-acetylglucosamine synthase-like glycosyltransferase